MFEYEVTDHLAEKLAMEHPQPMRYGDRDYMRRLRGQLDELGSEIDRRAALVDALTVELEAMPAGSFAGALRATVEDEQAALEDARQDYAMVQEELWELEGA